MIYLSKYIVEIYYRMYTIYKVISLNTLYYKILDRYIYIYIHNTKYFLYRLRPS